MEKNKREDKSKVRKQKTFSCRVQIFAQLVRKTKVVPL